MANEIQIFEVQMSLARPGITYAVADWPHPRQMPGQPNDRVPTAEDVVKAMARTGRRGVSMTTIMRHIEVARVRGDSLAAIIDMLDDVQDMPA